MTSSFTPLFNQALNLSSAINGQPAPQFNAYVSRGQAVVILYGDNTYNTGTLTLNGNIVTSTNNNSSTNATGVLNQTSVAVNGFIYDLTPTTSNSNAGTLSTIEYGAYEENCNNCSVNVNYGLYSISITANGVFGTQSGSLIAAAGLQTLIAPPGSAMYQSILMQVLQGNTAFSVQFSDGSAFNANPGSGNFYWTNKAGQTIVAGANFSGQPARSVVQVDDDGDTTYDILDDTTSEPTGDSITVENNGTVKLEDQSGNTLTSTTAATTITLLNPDGSYDTVTMMKDANGNITGWADDNGIHSGSPTDQELLTALPDITNTDLLGNVLGGSAYGNTGLTAQTMGTDGGGLVLFGSAANMKLIRNAYTDAAFVKLNNLMDQADQKQPTN